MLGPKRFGHVCMSMWKSAYEFAAKNIGYISIRNDTYHTIGYGFEFEFGWDSINSRTLVHHHHHKMLITRQSAKMKVNV